MNFIKNEKAQKLLHKFVPYLIITPAFIFLLIFVFYPMVNLIYLSFFKYNIVNPNKIFVGFQHYYNMFFVKTDFLIALKNTAVYTFMVVFFIISLSLLFAVYIQKNTFLNKIAQTAFFTPHLIAMISCGLIFAWLMDSDVGVFNSVLNFLHLPSLRWLNDSRTAMISVVFVSVWKGIGYYSLIILTGLQAIPQEIYEAARLDNAKKFRTFFKITIPMVSPQIFFLLITITIGSFKVFDTISVMTNGGPGNATDVLATYIYRFSFVYFQVGFASAASTILMLIVMVLTAVYFKILGKKVYYSN